MICPRCDHDQAYKFFESPESGAWEVYRCPRCHFNWRSTEEETVTDPKRYDPKFKLDEKRIREMAPKPPIPPLRKPMEEKGR
jgi:vanillate/4-hydroxybenzoate decarboxylase subunit D